MCAWLGIDLRDPRLHWSRLHDTEYLAFLCDPHALQHGLKEMAERHLNWAPDEKDEVAVWVYDRRRDIEFTLAQLGATEEDGRPITVKRSNKKTAAGLTRASNAMEFMQYVPGSLAGPYACGDTDRTWGLFEIMWAYVVEWDMMAAYDRERELMPILLENEQQGIRVDVEELTRDCEMYERAMAFVEDKLRARLDAPGLNFDADQDYAWALIRAGIVPEESFSRTPKKGEFQVGKDVLTPDMFSDPLVASAMGYRNRLKTCMTMFMRKWLYHAPRNGGFVSTNWNQTRGGDGGTRTGRPSTSGVYNALNISKDFEGRTDGYVHPDFLGVPKLPLVRRYMLPDEGDVWLHRDFDGQELRVFAHFEGRMWAEEDFAKSLLAAYQATPTLDPHAWVGGELLKLTGIKLERTRAKIMNFQSLYGGGLPAIQNKMKCSAAEAKQFREYHNQALPGRKLLDDNIKRAVKLGEPIRTWGGRIYFVEEPRFVNRRLQTFDYKLINYLVQGSAADLTKQAIIDWYNNPQRTSRFLVTVYDEINVSARRDGWQFQMELLKYEMNKQRLDCPMLSAGKFGERWGALEKCE